MLTHGRTCRLLFLALAGTVSVALPGALRAAQQADLPPPDAKQPNASDRMLETGQVTVAGRSVPYRIHRLPVSSFPDLPAAIAAQLDRRGCMIPQTYEAHHPENVVHASLEKAGSSDWAVLCSVHGTVSLLVFFGSAPANPAELAQTAETRRLQRHDSTGIYGFNWGIDPANPETVHDAVSGPDRPPRLDHDALSDSVVDHATRYHIYTQHTWTVVIPDS